MLKQNVYTSRIFFYLEQSCPYKHQTKNDQLAKFLQSETNICHYSCLFNPGLHLSLPQSIMDEVLIRGNE